MATQQIETEQWRNIPPTPPTTFPSHWFLLYSLCTLLILPIHFFVCIVNGTYKLLLYVLNKSFYYRSNRLLTPIDASPNSFVIITGAASGIGKDMTSIYASKGFSIILIDLNEDGLKKYTKELKQKYLNQTFMFLTIDLSKPNAAQQIYDKIINEWSVLNVVILVNNAGFGYTGDFVNQNIDKLKTMITVNATICVELGHKFGRYFVQRGQGRICQIASVAAFVPGSHAAIYHATKSFVRNWAIAFHHELVGTGVGVTVVCPGPVRTQFAKKSNSTKSLIFTKYKWLTYDSMSVANAAVNGTLAGKRQVIHGPFWHFCQNLITPFGETYNMIQTKYLWQDPGTTHRSSYVSYKKQ